MNRSTLVAGGALAAAALLFGAVLLPAPADESPTAPRLTAAGTDAAGVAEEALALVQRARDEASPDHLSAAEQRLRRSLRLDPDNVEAAVGMAALANARHDFSASVRWSRQAIAGNPAGASAYGLLGDALFELGRVRASERAYQAMVDRRPDTASYIRASYALQHRGETQAALRTMRLAVEAAGPAGESAAFAWHQLADIYAGQGRHAAAERANRNGIAIAPGYVPPTVGVAEARLARGRVDSAIPILERAAASLPTIEYLVTLGDAYTAAGRDADAAATYDRAAQALASYRRHGVLPDADFIVFYADHGLRPRAALREARAIYRNRPTPKVADALGWLLHRLGRHDQARPYVRQAVAAPGASAVEFFHAAQVELALGNRALAARSLRTALRVDPTFSIVDAAIARRQLEAIT